MLGPGLAACVPATRNEPSLEQKCRELADQCEGLPAAREDLAECYAIGRRGMREAEHMDQCFLAWDECIDECEYLSFELAGASDGG